MATATPLQPIPRTQANLERDYTVARFPQLGSKLAVRLDGDRGKGVFATAPIAKDTFVLREEPPLVCVQTALNKKRGVVACSQCLRAVGTPEQQLQRCLGLQSPPKLPFVEQCVRSELLVLDGIPCRYTCGDVYCCRECEARAYEQHHRLLCIAAPSSNADALRRFNAHAAENSQHLLMAARIIAHAVSRAEANGGELVDAWEPYAQFCALPWNFQLAYNPDTHQLEDETPLKKQLVRESVALLAAALPSSFEKYPALFAVSHFNTMIGMIELNAIEVGSHSALRRYLVGQQHLEPEQRLVATEAVAPFLSALLSKGIEEVPNVEGTGLFPIQSSIQHSCEPNACPVKFADERDCACTIIALRRIQKGEQIYVSYIECEGVPRSERQAQLRGHFCFECACTLCESEKPRKK